MTIYKILLRSLFMLLACLCFSTIYAQQDEPYDEPYNDSSYDNSYDNNSYDNNYNNNRGINSLDFNQTMQLTKNMISRQDNQAMRARNSKKISESLEGFLQTEFIKKLKNLKLEVETLTSTFKSKQQSFTPEEILSVKKAYAQFADKYNRQLTAIKNDFMDRKKIKMIRKFPEMYGNTLELKLRELSDEYAQTLQKAVAEVTQSDEYSALPIMAIMGIIQLGMDFSNFLATRQFNVRKIQEEHLNRYFIQEFKLKKWNNIQTVNGGGGYNNYNNEDNYQPSNYDNEVDSMNTDSPYSSGKKDDIEEVDPFEKQIPKPKKGNN